MLLNTLFGSQGGRQQQHRAPLQTNPEDSPVASQGHAWAGTETAEVGAPASDAHRIAEVSSAEDTADADGSARNNQTAYGQTAEESMVETGAMLSDGGALHKGEDRHVVEDVSKTEAALAGAQQAQQQAAQAQQQALAEERQSLMHLRQDMQQQSGQLSPSLRPAFVQSAVHIPEVHILMPSVRYTLNRLAWHGPLMLASSTKNRGASLPWHIIPAS